MILPPRPEIRRRRGLGAAARIGPGAPRRRGLPARNQRQVPQPAVDPGEPALDHPAQVLEQVPAVDDLDRRG